MIAVDAARRGINRRRLMKGGVALAATAALGARGRALANHSTPVSGSILAEGVAEIPSDPFAWRLVRDVAPVAGDGAEMLERALGFVYAPDGLEIVTADAGSVAIDSGEAAFVPEGVFQRHQSPTEAPVDYLRIGIVPAEDADYTAGGELLLGSDAFPAPDRRRMLRLYGIELGAGEMFTFPPSAAPILVHVLSGGASIGRLIDDSAGKASEPLSGEPFAAGTGATHVFHAAPGERWGLGGGEATTAIAAVIGEALPGLGMGPGEIIVQVFACPDGAFLSPENADCAYDEAMASLSFAKLEGNGLELTLDDMTSREGDLGWQGLPLGDYTLYVENDYWVTAGPGDEAGLGEPAGNTALAWPVALTAENPRVLLKIFGATA